MRHLNQYNKPEVFYGTLPIDLNILVCVCERKEENKKKKEEGTNKLTSFQVTVEKYSSKTNTNSSN